MYVSNGKNNKEITSVHMCSEALVNRFSRT